MAMGKLFLSAFLFFACSFVVISVAADEPATTQPLMYKKIRNHKTTRRIYAEKLIRENTISEEQSTAMAAARIPIPCCSPSARPPLR